MSFPSGGDAFAVETMVRDSERPNPGRHARGGLGSLTCASVQLHGMGLSLVGVGGALLSTWQTAPDTPLAAGVAMPRLTGGPRHMSIPRTAPCSAQAAALKPSAGLMAQEAKAEVLRWLKQGHRPRFMECAGRAKRRRRCGLALCLRQREKRCHAALATALHRRGKTWPGSLPHNAA